ncbi:hypothetical protein HWV62_34629 [Athelia sp. TMB]|nr:hypothetical protein HWV62_34629 [Athelia sp. TMB]
MNNHTTRDSRARTVASEPEETGGNTTDMEVEQALANARAQAAAEAARGRFEPRETMRAKGKKDHRNQLEAKGQGPPKVPFVPKPTHRELILPQYPPIPRRTLDAPLPVVPPPVAASPVATPAVALATPAATAGVAAASVAGVRPTMAEAMLSAANAIREAANAKAAAAAAEKAAIADTAFLADISAKKVTPRITLKVKKPKLPLRLKAVEEEDEQAVEDVKVIKQENAGQKRPRSGGDQTTPQEGGGPPAPKHQNSVILVKDSPSPEEHCPLAASRYKRSPNAEAGPSRTLIPPSLQQLSSSPRNVPPMGTCTFHSSYIVNTYLVVKPEGLSLEREYVNLEG